MKRAQLETLFKVWEKRVTDMRPSDLRKLEEVVVREFQAAKSEPARDLAKRKLVTIRLQLRGPVVVRCKSLRRSPTNGRR